MEEYLRKLGYFDKGARGILLRRYGISVETEREAEKNTKK